MRSYRDPKFEQLLKEQATAVNRLFTPAALMMAHDEYRVLGWTEPALAGLDKDATPGQLLTHNAKVCYDTIVQANHQREC